MSNIILFDHIQSNSFLILLTFVFHFSLMKSKGKGEERSLRAWIKLILLQNSEQILFSMTIMILGEALFFLFKPFYWDMIDIWKAEHI